MWLKATSGLILLLLSPGLSIQMQEPPAPARTSRNNPIEGFVDVRRHQFMASDTDTFKLRYYYNSEFARNHIVIVVGGEWGITPGFTTGGFGYDLAQKLGAGLFYVEHRFYGQSRPFPDTNQQNLRLLSVDQALADLAQFIQYVKSDNFHEGFYRNSNVALVGCSYAGSMATWMRLAYPHLIHAAFSDSGPLYAQENFPEYLEVVANAIRSQGSQECLSSIQLSMERVVSLLGTAAGPARVMELFRTCSAIQSNSTSDVATFFWYGVTEAFAHLVQNARPGDIARACGVLTNSDVSDPVQRLGNWITSQPLSQPCIETRYSEVMAAHRNTSYASENVAMRLWTYQTCVEFGWYQTTNSSGQPFLTTVPLEYFHQMCKDFFSAYFDEDVLRSGISRTNLFFGERILPDGVVSVVGGDDPWSPMGPRVANAHSHAPVYHVPGISHCNAIGSAGSSGSEELERVRVEALRDMEGFTKGEFVIKAGASIRASLMLLIASVVYILF